MVGASLGKACENEKKSLGEDGLPRRFVLVIGLNDNSSDFHPEGPLYVSKRQETGHLWQRLSSAHFPPPSLLKFGESKTGTKTDFNCKNRCLVYLLGALKTTSGLKMSFLKMQPVVK